MANIFKTIFNFYYEGFKNLTSISRKLWLLIFVKTAIILTILNIFFPDLLWQYNTDEEKIDAVSTSLLNIK
jgi:hypothetical protein